jgi:uncharacterized membrane protein HdeD (DUF308 family)
MNITENPLSTLLSQTWWVLLLRGLFALAFGVITLLQPAVTLAWLLMFFAFYTLADGVLGVWSAIAGRKENEHWGVMLLWGLAGIVVGLLVLTSPGVTVLALLFYIAIWAIATGILEIVAAIRLRKEIEGEWLLILGGLASVAFGIFLMAHPGAGAISLVWLIGSFAMVFGIILVLLALKVRKLGILTT